MCVIYRIEGPGAVTVRLRCEHCGASSKEVCMVPRDEVPMLVRAGWVLHRNPDDNRELRATCPACVRRAQRIQNTHRREPVNGGAKP